MPVELTLPVDDAHAQPDSPADRVEGSPGASSGSPSRTRNRTRLLSGLGLPAITAATASHAQTVTDPAASWRSPELRLVRRTTLGLNAEEAARARSLGYARYLDYQLNPAAIDDTACERFVSQNYPQLSLSAAALRTLPSWDMQQVLTDATLYRSIFSRRQLYQRMVEFWTDHFNIDFQKSNVLKMVDDRTVIRPHALGSFPAMLSASAHSPAMLQYLDNDDNRRERPNINYGRELLELMTMGVTGGYTPDDIREVARCFTGWRFECNVGATWGTFVFDRQLHDDGRKVVLGQTIAAGGGVQDGETVLRILSAHPSTARFLATKICRWLLSYDPPAAAVDSVAAAYTRTGGDISSMVRAALDRNLVAAAPAKLKRPYHLLVSAIRAMPVTVTNMQGLRQFVRQLGQTPFTWDAPDGFPDRVDFWAGLVLSRWNFAVYLAENRIPGVAVNTTSYENALAATAIANLVDTNLYGGEMPVAERNALVQYLLPGNAPADRVREGLGLALSAPGFQWY